MTRDDLLRYVSTLGPETQALFHQCDSLEKESSDTLSEEYQIAAAILEIFNERAKDRETIR